MMKHLQNKIGLLTYPGSPLAYPTVAALQKRGYKEIYLISDGDKPNEKFIKIIDDRTGGKAIFHSMVDFQKMNVPFFFVKDHNSEETLNLLRNLNLDILGSCGTPRKLKTIILYACQYGIVNCHPGRLPDYRGSSTVEWALLNGDAVAASAHFMTEEYDAGPVIETYPFSTKGLSYAEIRLQMIDHQAQSLADGIDRVLRAGKLPSEYAPQPPSQKPLWTVFPEEQMKKMMNRRF